MSLLRLRARSLADTCCYCRDRVDGGRTCLGCHAVYHAECASELGRCGTVGCGFTVEASIPQSAPLVPMAQAPAPLRALFWSLPALVFLLADAAHHGLGSQVQLVVILVALLAWPWEMAKYDGHTARLPTWFRTGWIVISSALTLAWGFLTLVACVLVGWFTAPLLSRPRDRSCHHCQQGLDLTEAVSCWNCDQVFHAGCGEHPSHHPGRAGRPCLRTARS